MAATFANANNFRISVTDGLLEFRSGDERVAHFPAWEHVERDLRHFALIDIPTGSPAEPYDDRDDSWHLSVYEDEGFVYILEGDDPASDTFTRQWRVPANVYFAAWEEVIRQFHPAMDLDGLGELDGPDGPPDA